MNSEVDVMPVRFQPPRGTRDFLPEEMIGTIYYHPLGYGKEKEIKQLLDERRKKVEEARGEDSQ